VRDGFLAIAKAEPSRVVVIDADRPVGAVAADIRRAVDEMLARR
jgi:dTMP kinase